MLVGGAPATKAARQVAADEPVQVVGDAPRFVSRGGLKLEAALDRFELDVADKRALDAGASTGGFTDCLLQRGAAEVVAVDVGSGQMHERVRSDPRVRVVDKTNIRHATPESLGVEPFDLVVADLSFISLRSVADALVGLVGPDGDLVVLVKPQFEAGRVEASRGKGVIRDPEIWRRALEEVGSALAAAGAVMMGVMVSPLRGAEGNVEFLLHGRRGTGRGAALEPTELDAVVMAAADGGTSEGG